MTKSGNCKFLYLLVYSALGLSPALSLACQDTPVDGSTESTSTSLSTANESSAVAPLLAGGDPSHEGRGPWAKERLDKLFQRFDKDGDGKIALKDLPGRLRERLGSADTNNDGQLTRDEIVKAWQAKAAEMKKRIDTNGDGVISEDERAKARAAYWDKRFAELDTNKDGALTADEVPARMWERIKVADSNGDNKITRAEIDAALASGKLKHMHPSYGHHDTSNVTTQA
jgi:Ca2+-binding EF-hand superfamily protein